MKQFIQLILLVAFSTLQAQNDTVTFQVDMNDYSGPAYTTVNLNGTFNGWCGACNAMTDANSDGVWEVSLPITAGAVEYKFTLDAWTAQEQFTAGTSCTVTNGGFTNRSYTVAGNATLPLVCYNSCSVCTGIVLSQADLPITWDDASVNYSTVSFGGMIDSLAVDPTDATNSVIKLDKGLGTQTWAGTTLSHGGLATAIPFTASGHNTISVRFWSADAGVPVLLKVEDKTNGAVFLEAFDTTTVASGWEVLVFDFNTAVQPINTANTYDLVSLFPNFGTEGNVAGAKTYYADNVEYGVTVTGMSGVYTIDPAGSGSRNYANFSASAADLVSLGVIGPVTFNVAAGSYTDTVYLPTIMGTSSTNTIMFDGGDSATTSLAYNTAAVNQNAVVLMDGADYVSFKGLTITHSGTTDSWGIRMQNDNDNFTVDACRFEMVVTTSTSGDIAAIASSGSATSSFTETEGGDNTTIVNSAFINGQYGVHFEALSTFSDSNFVISNNVFEGNYYRYYMSDNTYNVTLNGNTMSGMTYAFGYAVAFYDVIGFEINNNNITCPDWGLYMSDANFDGSPAATSNVTNNMITSAGDEAFYADDFESANVYYNTFVTTSTSTSAYGAYFNDCKLVEVKNNVFYGTATYAVWFSDNTTLTASTSDPIALDYNLYYTLGGTSLAWDGGAQADLAAWQTARATNNVNSLSGDPIFIDPASNLHMAGAAANNAATPLAAVTMDIDGDMRSATTPDIGADEYLPATCLPVSGVSTLTAYADSVSMTWIGNNGAGTLFNVEFGPIGFTPGTGTAISALTDSTITVTGLMPNGDYELYVTADCGAGGIGSTVGPTAFRTALAGPRVITCATGTSGSLFTEEFDNSTSFTGDIAAGNGTWLYDFNNTGSSSTGPSGPHSGSHYIYVETSGGADSASMVSPAIDLAAASQNVELSFWMHAYGATIGTLKVGVSTSATGPFTNMFTYGPGQLQTDELDPYQNIGINLDAYLGQTVYVEFRYIKGTSYTGDIAIDLVEVKTCLSCLTPSALASSNITSTSADITWTSGASNLGSVIEYGPAGFTPGTGSTMTTTLDSVNLSGLMPAMSYDAYVTDSCGLGDISGSAGPISFTTLCPASLPAPYTTDFENITIGHQATYENCWTTSSATTPRWEAEDASGVNENSSGTGPFYDNTSFGAAGGTYMYLETSSGAGLNSIMSPTIDISGLTVPQLDFFYHMYGATMGTLRVYAEDTAGTLTILDSIVGQQQTAGSDAWLKKSISLSGLTDDFYRFVFEGERGASFTGDISIDDVSVIEAPNCVPSTALSMISASTTSADVTWTAGSGSNWDVEYGPAGFTPGTGTMINVANDTITISGLTASTAYDFYVTDSCGSANGVATTAGPGSFATSVCLATNQCAFTVDLLDAYGDGWNGGEITIWQNGVAIASLGSGFTTGASSLGNVVNLCDNFVTTVTLSNAGSWSSEMGFVINNPLGAIAATHLAVGGLATGDTLLTFTTDCSACPALTAPYAESFDLTSTPNCWSQDANIGGPWLFSTNANSSQCASLSDHTGNSGAFAWMDQSGSDDSVSLVMPAVDISGLTSPYYEFYYGMCGVGYSPANITIIEFWNGANWQAGDTLDFATNGWQLVADTIPATWTYNSGTTVQLRFRAESGGAGADFYGDNAIDDVRIYETPSCFAPSNLALSNITAISLDVTWTDNGSASYGVIYGAAGFDPATAGTLLTTTNDTLGLSGLSVSTTYDVYIYSDCGSGDISDTIGPVSTSTSCAPIAPPSLEDFTNGWTPNTCWEEGDGGTPATGPSVLGTGGWATDGFANNGFSGAVKINLYNVGDEDWMLSPQYDLGTAGNLQVELDLGVYAWNSSTPAFLGSDDEVQLLISTDNGLTWVNLATADSSYVTNPGGNHGVTSLAAYTGVVQFAIWATEGTFDDPEDNDIFVDNFEVRVTPSCPDPASIAASNITSSAADITWTSSVGGVGSSVEYGPSGFTLGTGSVIVSTIDSVNISGLMAATTYDVYVTDSCGASGVSSTIGPLTFITQCPASFSAPYTTDFENITLGNQVSYENCWTTSSPLTPRWEAEDASGVNENSSGTGPFYDNTSFGAAGGTYMYLETSSLAGLNSIMSPTIDISGLTVPQLDFFYHMYGATMGTLRVYAEDTAGTLTILDSIVGQQQTAGGDAWLKKSISLGGLTDDFYRFVFEGERGASFTGDISIDDVSVIEAPNCVASTALSMISASTTSADVTWTAGTGTSWDVEYGLAGFTPGTGTMINVANDTITISGLTASTAYDFYVTDSCGSANGVATTAGPGSFSTSACSAANQCAYTFDLYDAFGDGWNGADITVYQNGVAVATLGASFGSGLTSLGNIVNLCDNVPTVITLSNPGSWSSEIGVVVLNPNGDTAGVHTAIGGLVSGDTLISFTSNCSACPAVATPYFESFEANSPTVGCWTNVFVADTLSWTLGSGAGGGVVTSAYAGAQNAVFASTAGGPDTTLFVSPIIDMSALISPQLSFWYAQEEWFGDQNVTNVYYRTSSTAPWTFLFGDNTNRNTWTQALVSLPNPSSTYQIAIEGVNNWGRANVIDSLSVTDAAIVCTAPDSVAAANITTTAADISWVSGSNQSSSWIEYGPLGFAPGTGLLVNPAVSAATLSGLMSGTIYEACVYDICSVLGDTSAASCVTFTTLCAPISTYPYTENFDLGILPACYASTGTTTGPFLWAPDAGGTPSGATGPAVDNTTGSGAGFYMYTEASSPAAAGDSAFFDLPEFDLTSLTVPEISYFYHMYGVDIQSLELQVYDATAMTWSSLNSIVGQQQSSNADAWMEARVDLSPYGASTSLQMRFLTVRGPSFSGDVALDDITVRETPACVDPTNLMVSNATGSGVSLSWNSDTNIVASTIEYGPIGFALGAGTQLTATPNGYTVTGLASGACFDFYVRDSCSSVTAWIGPVTACTIANCSVSTIPVSATSDTTDCDGGSVSLNAVSSSSNDLVWLNNGQAVGTGSNYISDSISFTTAFDVAEFVTTSPSLHIGPLTNIAATGFGNFSNGQWITVTDTVHIDSMVVNHNNDVQAQLVLWTDDSFTNMIQLSDTFSTPAGVLGDLRVPINMVVTPGVYFMNVNFISGAGQLFRATGGASYPYSLAGLMSIDSTNFGDQSRLYYTFDMTVSKACIGSSIQGFGIVPGANAGLTDTVTVCSTESTVDLTTFLGVYDFGGSWTDVSASGALTDSIFDASAVTAGASFDFSYIVPGVNGCAGDTALLNVTVEAAPDAGTDSTTAVCIGSGNVILRTFISGNPFGGTWVDLDNSGALNTTGVWRSNIASAGTFRLAYILSGTVCAPDTAIITIQSDSAVSAGLAVSDTVCDDETMVDLSTFLDASASMGGTWTDLSATGALSANMFDASAVANMSSYNFQYMVMSSCGNDSIVVTLFVDDCDVSVRELNTGFINIYPNPTNGVIKIEDKSVKGQVSVELYSGNGQLMLMRTFGENEEMSLDISDYATGIYTVKVNSEKGLDVKRIMKN